MLELFTFDPIQCGLVLLIILVVGDFLSTFSKGAMPAVLIAGLFYMVMSWIGVIPADFTEKSGLSAIAAFSMMFLIIGMGASMSIQTFIDNWKVAAASILTYLCQVGVLFLVVGGIYGYNVAIGGLPGGSATALIIQQKAGELGYDQTIVLSLLFFSTQAIIACPVASIFVRKETKRLLALPKNGEKVIIEEDAPAKRDKLFSHSMYGNLCKLFIAAWIAARLEMLTGVSKFVFALIIGVLFNLIGFMDKYTFDRSGSKEFCYFLMMSLILSGFAKASPSMFVSMLLPLFLVLLCQIGTNLTLGRLIGKLFGFSDAMAGAIGFNVMMGFPTNMMLSADIANALTDDPEERKYLEEQISTKMVIAGLATTTSVCVFMGGILSGFMS